MAPVSQVELLGFDHVDLRVKNREKTQRFLVEQLGLQVLGEGDTHTFLIIGDQVLGLHDLAPNAHVGGIDHIALRVADWTGLRNRIRRARITVTAEKERANSRSLYLKGPDGLVIELVYRPDPSIQECTSRRPKSPPPADDDDEDLEVLQKPASSRRR